jgi:hypothetical protein
MKRQIEKPSEPFMRFFTPDLYLRFNSPHDEVADEANDAWEEAIAKYQEHLDRLRKKMPPAVQRLADLCLHDAEIIEIREEDVDTLRSANAAETVIAPPGLRLGILSARQEHQAVSIFYILKGSIREYAAPGNWPFSKERTHLLYDEIDSDGDHPSGFVHRMLLSDGTVLEIAFGTAFSYCFDLHVKSVAR